MAGICALALAFAASTWIATRSCAYRGVSEGVTSGGVTTRVETCSSFLEVNGAGASWVLVLPVVLALAGAGAAVARRRAGVGASALLLSAFCLLGAASIGIVFLPSALALLAAAAMPVRGEPVVPRPSSREQGDPA